MVSIGINFITISDNWLQGLYQCPKLECHRLFIATFQKNHSTGYYNFTNSAPSVAIEKPVHAMLKDISSEYVETYQQSWRAKQLNLRNF